LRQPGGIPSADTVLLQPLLERMAGTTRPPRFPAPGETSNLSQAQQHDVYASIIGTRGNNAAHDALATQDRVILGLRNEDQTTQARGKGVYNDRIVVLTLMATAVPASSTRPPPSPPPNMTAMPRPRRVALPLKT
jgi:hypothetical protein